MSETTEKFMTLKDFAATVGVSYNTASVWHCRGYPDFPPCMTLPSGQIRIRPADFRGWCRERMS